MNARVSDRSHPLSGIDTTILPADGGPDFNRLIFEASPYLLQHAANPVDWYPWGEAAFARARERDCPIFLSIGYATCHWCHVMAHESFEDAEVAALLNRYFVTIKVDREERPDLDQLYMGACQLVSGNGGWPLNLFLTPERTAFFAATYIPKLPRDGNFGLLQLLGQIIHLWRDERGRLLEAAREIGSGLQQINAAANPASLGSLPLQQALLDFRRGYDPDHGGFGQAPKFPTPHQLLLLLRLAARFDAPDAAEMAVTTLRAIVSGGIHDQLGGGIHRYSVDAHWLVPHFEKMLYDQALIALAASEAWQWTRDPLLYEFVRSVVGYLLRDLRDPRGGFYSGEDADSDGAEGSYYLWTPQQLGDTLPRQEAELVARAYGVSAAGNFEGRSILYRAEPPEALAAALGVSNASIVQQLQQARSSLLQTREQRVRPLLDDKVICAWNGLTIATLARAGAVFADAAWLDAARMAADFLLADLTTPEGGLLRRWRRGQAAVPAFLEDYAATLWGLTELHQASLEERWLQSALPLAQRMLLLFDDDEGGLFDSIASELPLRPRSWLDGAFPAGASLAAYALLRLGRLCAEEGLEERGRQLLQRQLGQAQRHPSGATLLLQGLDFALGPVTEVTLALAKGDTPERWRKDLRPHWLPRLLWRQPTTGGATSSAQVCRAQTCLVPVSDPSELRSLLTASESLR